MLQSNHLIGFGANENAVQYVGWSPTDKSAGYTVSSVIGINSDANTTSGSGWQCIRAAIGRSVGKYYWETEVITVGGADEYLDGAADNAFAMNTGIGAGISSAGMRSDNNVTGWTKSQTTTLSGNNTAGAVLGYALDMPNGRLYVSVNNVYAFSGNPVAGTGFWVSGITGTVYPAASSYNNNARKLRLRTLASQMTGTIPAGYTAWAGG